MAEELIDLVKRGFEGTAAQLRERDSKVALLSEKMVGVELKLDQLKETLANKLETDRITMRVEMLEAAQGKVETKALDNAKWIKGLAASVILLLLAVIFNAVRIQMK